MVICPDKYNKCLERVKQNGWVLGHVPKKYITEELVKIAIQQYGLTLPYVPKKYISEELLFMAQQTNLYTGVIPTELATRIFEIYETMGE